MDKFDRKLLGYDIEQVNQFVDDIEQVISQWAQDELDEL